MAQLKRIPINKMKPYDIAYIPTRNDEIIMRTASTTKFEVMSLSKQRPNRCWTELSAGLEVTLLPMDEVRLTIEEIPK